MPALWRPLGLKSAGSVGRAEPITPWTCADSPSEQARSASSPPGRPERAGRPAISRGTRMFDVMRCADAPLGEPSGSHQRTK